MSSKFINLLAVSTLAILACSFGATPVNALSGESHNFVRHVARSHDHFVKKRKRGDKGRCKVRPPTDNASPAGASTNGSPAPADNSGKDYGNNNSGSPPQGNNAQTQTGNQNSNPGNNNSGNNNSGNNNSGSNNFPTNSGGSGKCGLAWPNGPDPALANFKSDKVSQLYTWAPQIPDNARQLGFNVAPMLWGPNQLDDFKRLVQPGYANTVMGFNEPNEPSQSNLDAGSACQLWKDHVAPLKNQGYRLISPATTSAPNGKVWMQDFFGHGCDADVVALHWYDIDADAFIAYVQDFHNTFGKNIWVTEYACQNFNGGAQCSRDKTFAFHDKVTKWMESQDFVEHFFPFGAMHQMQGVNPDNQLMADDGGLTDLGHYYVHG